MWPEVDAVKSENRRELKLAGANVSKRIVENGGNLDDAIYQLSALNLLDVSDTALEKISPRIDALNHLQSLLLYRNKIAQLPATIGQLGELKVLDLSGNRLTKINLKGNPLKDKRLLKLVDQCRSKQVLDYVEKNGYVPPKTAPKQEADENQSNGTQESSTSVPEEDIQLKIVVHKATENTPKVTFTQEARANRPHILLCIVRNFPLTNMKKFLQLQNALHDNECGRRELATIATHDLAKIKGSIRYHAAPPGEIQITALGAAAQGKVTAEKYYADLCHQADLLRKEKKRNTYSGVHKYITLLTCKELFAFLSDEEKVISLPPLTNCDETKISSTCTDMLVEVTSSVGHGPCVRVMNALLERMLLMEVEVVGSTVPHASTNGNVSKPGEKKLKKSKAASKEPEIAKVCYNRSATLTVEQVQLYDGDGKLHSVFPGKGDLVGNETARIFVEMA
uniref:B3/B4 tRNA-binding domain-containing protein n=1 Tax=Anopheles maculatus TaxID=74869 RepID=A0A182T817_9DIPT